MIAGGLLIAAYGLGNKDAQKALTSLGNWIGGLFQSQSIADDFDDGDDFDNQPKAKPTNGEKPADAPTGTKPIDQAGLDRETIHRIKKETGQGAAEWTGIAPNGDVIVNKGGKAKNLGPHTDYLP